MATKASHTTISIQPELRNRLRAHLRGGETYADLLEELLEQSDREPAVPIEAAD